MTDLVGNSVELPEEELDEIQEDFVVDFGLDFPQSVEVLDFPTKTNSGDFTNSNYMYEKMGYSSNFGHSKPRQGFLGNYHNDDLHRKIHNFRLSY